MTYLALRAVIDVSQKVEIQSACIHLVNIIVFCRGSCRKILLHCVCICSNISFKKGTEKHQSCRISCWYLLCRTPLCSWCLEIDSFNASETVKKAVSLNQACSSQGPIWHLDSPQEEAANLNPTYSF